MDPKVLFLALIAALLCILVLLASLLLRRMHRLSASDMLPQVVNLAVAELSASAMHHAEYELIRGLLAQVNEDEAVFQELGSYPHRMVLAVLCFDLANLRARFEIVGKLLIRLTEARADARKSLPDLDQEDEMVQLQVVQEGLMEQIWRLDALIPQYAAHYGLRYVQTG